MFKLVSSSSGWYYARVEIKRLKDNALRCADLLIVIKDAAKHIVGTRSTLRMWSNSRFKVPFDVHLSVHLQHSCAQYYGTTSISAALHGAVLNCVVRDA